MANERYYVVVGKTVSDGIYLVEANAPSSALRAIGEHLFTCQVAKAADIVKHMSAGVTLLKAPVKPEQTDIEDIIDEQRQQ